MNLVSKTHPGCIYFWYRSGLTFAILIFHHTLFLFLGYYQSPWKIQLAFFFLPWLYFWFQTYIWWGGSFKHNLSIVEIGKALGARRVILRWLKLGVSASEKMLPSTYQTTKLSVKNNPTWAPLNALGSSCHTSILSLPDIIMSLHPHDKKQAYGKGVITSPLVV